MGKKREIDPNRWSASLLASALDCPEQLRRKLAGEKPPEPPIFVAGSAVHGAARFAVWHKGFRRTAERPIFFKSAEAFLKWWWTYWSQTVEKKGERGIRWREGKSDEQFAGLGSYGGELLTGLRWLGTEAPRQLMRVRRGYYQMMVDPGISFELVAAEKWVQARFGQFLLVGRVDQIWRVEPCPAFEVGGVMLVDLTMGVGPEKYAQLVLYSLLFRLVARQDPKFREEILGIPRNRRLSEEEIAGLREEAVAVLPLSEAKLKLRRPGGEDYAWLRDRLGWAAAEAREIMRGEEVVATPTDAVCRYCEFGYDCRYAATREVVDLETGGYDVLASPPPEPELAKQPAFSGWLRGAVVKQEVRREPLVQMPMFALPEGG